MACFLITGAFVAAALIISPQVPIITTETLGPSEHSDYVRTLGAGRTVSIEIVVLAGTPPSPSDTVVLLIMDPYNYNLKESGEETYYPLLELGATSRTSFIWHTPTTSEYYFILTNFSLSNATVSMSVTWEIEWVPGVEVALVIGFVLIALIAVGYDYMAEIERLYAPELMRFSGDLDVFAETVTTAPQRLHPATVAVPHGTKCAICDSYLGEHDLVSFCPRCGSPSHSDHLQEWLSKNRSCPACASQLDE